MAQKKVEIFTAGCACCGDTDWLVRSIACPSCDVQVLDMKVAAVERRAREPGVHSVPGVAIEGELADCYAGRGPTEEALRAAGIGQGV